MEGIGGGSAIFPDDLFGFGIDFVDAGAEIWSAINTMGTVDKDQDIAVVQHRRIMLVAERHFAH